MSTWAGDVDISTHGVAGAGVDSQPGVDDAASERPRNVFCYIIIGITASPGSSSLQQ